MKYSLGSLYEYLKDNRTAFLKASGLLVIALIAGFFVNEWFAIIIGAAGVASAFWNLKNAFIIYVAATILIPSRFSWRIDVIDIGPSRLFLVLFLLTCVYYWHKGEVKFRKTPVDIAILVLLFSMLLSISINSLLMTDTQFIQAFKTLGVSLIEWFLIFYAVSSIAKSREEVEKLVKTIMVFAASISLIGMLEFVTKLRIYDWLLKYLPDPSHATDIGLQASGSGVLRAGMGRIVSTTISPHEVGLLMAMCLPFALYFLAYKKKIFKKSIWMLVVALIVIALGLSITRGALIAAAAVLICLTLLSYKRHLRFGMYFVMVFVLMTFIFLPHIRQTFVGIVQSGVKMTLAGSTASDTALKARTEDWPQAKILLKDNELAGIGLGMVTGHQLDYENQVDPSFFYTDNYYIAALTETGIIGISAYFFLALGIIAFLTRREMLLGIEGLRVRDLRIVFLASLAPFFAMCATFDAFAFSTVSRFFWIILGLAASLAISEVSSSKMVHSA